MQEIYHQQYGSTPVLPSTQTTPFDAKSLETLNTVFVPTSGFAKHSSGKTAHLRNTPVLSDGVILWTLSLSVYLSSQH